MLEPHVIVEIDDSNKHNEEYIKRGCLVEFVPADSNDPARIRIYYCDLHERVKEIDTAREHEEERANEAEAERDDMQAERDEMLDRLGMTEHEWTMRRTWVGAPQTTLALPLAQPVKRRARRAKGG